MSRIRDAKKALPSEPFVRVTDHFPRHDAEDEGAVCHGTQDQF